MVTRNQANSIADALLAQERARSAARSSRRYWAFPELDMIEAERRAQVRREANRAVARNWLLHLAALSWIAAYALTWGFLVPAGDRHSALLVFMLGASVPIPFFYAACVRRRVRQIVRSMLASASSGLP
jgi:hypothetical protein